MLLLSGPLDTAHVGSESLMLSLQTSSELPVLSDVADTLESNLHSPRPPHSLSPSKHIHNHVSRPIRKIVKPWMDKMLRKIIPWNIGGVELICDEFHGTLSILSFRLVTDDAQGTPSVTEDSEIQATSSPLVTCSHRPPKRSFGGYLNGASASQRWWCSLCDVVCSFTVALALMILSGHFLQNFENKFLWRTHLRQQHATFMRLNEKMRKANCPGWLHDSIMWNYFSFLIFVSKMLSFFGLQ